MSPALVSLLAVTIGFTVMVVWVYWPSRRTRMERYARIPLADEPEVPVAQEKSST